jgi:hypothetical protein
MDPDAAGNDVNSTNFIVDACAGLQRVVTSRVVWKDNPLLCAYDNYLRIADCCCRDKYAVRTNDGGGAGADVFADTARHRLIITTHRVNRGMRAFSFPFTDM